MAYIHELPGWPELTWRTGDLAELLAAVRHRQGRHLGRMEALGFDLRAEAQVIALTQETVQSSAIEGAHLDPDEVRSSIARRYGLETAGLPTPSREVEGVVEVMLDATRHCDAPLTAERLFGWHAALFPTGRSGRRPIVVGAWRTGEAGPMQVVSGALGRERIHFIAPDASLLETEMERFLRWFNAAHDIDPILKAGVVHLWFVTLHPFADGNGRLARAIADMLLSRADRAPGRFYSMSAQIEAERRDHYRALESAQGGGLDITGWLAWFLGCLDRAIVRAEGMLAAVLRKAQLWQRIGHHPVNDRQRLILSRMAAGFERPLTNSKYARVAKCSSDTALRDIRALLELGILVKNPAGGRSTSYRLAALD